MSTIVISETGQSVGVESDETTVVISDGETVSDADVAAEAAARAAQDVILHAELEAEEAARLANQAQQQAAIAALAAGGGLGDMLSTNNLSELADPAEARTNLGLGTAAVENVTAFASTTELTDLTDSFGNAAFRDVGITNTDVAAGNAPQQAVDSMPSVDTTDAAKAFFDTQDVGGGELVTFLDVSNLASLDDIVTAGGGVASVNGEVGAVDLSAADIPFTPDGTIAATTVQAAIIEVRDEAGGGSPAASTVTFTPAGTIAATNAQAAVEEVASEAATALSTHAAVTTAIHGIADTTALVVTGDARLSDARTPTAHKTSHQDGGTDELALDASQITTGTHATARLGSGTANSSTFLRGDQTWAAPVGGGDLLAANNLSDVASAPTARTNLGLGTAATQATGAFDTAGAAAAAQAAAIAASQPVDSDLTSIAALTTTSYGRAFLALADAAAGRTALGLGTAALNATGDFDAAGTAAAAVAALVNSAPGALDTLDELAAALGDDANFAATITTAIAGKQPLDSDLTAIAALTTTSFGRSFLALADAAAARAALALGGAAVLNVGTTTGTVAAGDDSRFGSGGPPTGSAGGDLTGSTYPNPTIAAGTVTLAKQANLAANSFQGNNTGSAATPIALTVAQAKTLLALAKADVGLGNVDNTSNVTERAATATLTNKTLTAPVVNSPTGIVKADVGLGNVDNTADASKTFNASAITAGTMATARLGSGTANSTSFLRGDQTWAAPVGGGDLLAANNLSDLANVATARTNLLTGTRSTFSNANHTIPATATRVVQTGTLSVPRTATLPAANAVPAGWRITLTDISGTPEHGKEIIWSRAGSDTILNETDHENTTTLVTRAAYGSFEVESDGTSKWLVVGRGGQRQVAFWQTERDFWIRSGVWTPIPWNFTPTDDFNISPNFDQFTTTVAAGSNGVDLATNPATINVASTTGFPTSGYIVITGPPGSGDDTVVGYTGVTGTSFTGCNSTTTNMQHANLGVGTLATSQAVKGANCRFTLGTPGIFNQVLSAEFDANDTGTRGIRSRAAVASLYLPHCSHTEFTTGEVQNVTVAGQPASYVGGPGSHWSEVYQNSGDPLRLILDGIQAPLFMLCFGASQ